MEILVDINGSDNGIDEAIRGVVNSIGKTKAKLTMVGAPEEVIDIIMGCVIIFIAISGVFKALFMKFGKKK